MEKRLPHYPLPDIQAQMTAVEAMNLTESARKGIRQAGMVMTDALKVVRGLSRTDFYKSMTTYSDHRVWQDVYHSEWRGKPFSSNFRKLANTSSYRLRRYKNDIQVA